MITTHLIMFFFNRSGGGGSGSGGIYSVGGAGTQEIVQTLSVATVHHTQRKTG